MPKLKQKLKKLIDKAKSQKTAYFKLLLQKLNIITENIKNSIKLGGISEHQAKSLVLIFLIAFTGFVILFRQYYSDNFFPQKNYVEKKNPKEIEKEKLRKDLSILVKGHPIEMMIPYIAKKDRVTAAYLIGIAKKESNWGKRHPALAGQDCYNYWGFRAQRERMGSGGHTCFDSPREAVDVVSRRIAEIIERNDAQSAHDMLVWKCGSDCSVTGGQRDADKWALDVDFYAEKILN
jgi:hypothetical protein